jgi:hypothetical protein
MKENTREFEGASLSRHFADQVQLTEARPNYNPTREEFKTVTLSAGGEP